MFLLGLSSLSRRSMLKEDFMTDVFVSRGLLKFCVVFRFIYIDMFSSAIFDCLVSSFFIWVALGVRVVFELTNKLFEPPTVPLSLRVDSTCS